MNKKMGNRGVGRWGVYGVILFAVGFFFVARAGFGGEEETKTSKNQSFLRIELLGQESVRLQLSARNIFSPRRAASTREGIPENYPEASIPEGAGGAESGASTSVSESALDLRYIGYVFSGINRVAVIVYQGETLAVRVGEGIDDRYRVTSVTQTEVRLSGPDEKTFVFPLEGERT